MDADPIYICTVCEEEYDRTADWDSDVVCRGCGYDWFECEGCETTYRTGDLWDDQMFCFVCYHERYPCPDWCADINSPITHGYVRISEGDC